MPVVPIKGIADVRLGGTDPAIEFPVGQYVFAAAPKVLIVQSFATGATRTRRESATFGPYRFVAQARRELASLTGFHNFGHALPGKGMLDRLPAAYRFQRNIDLVLHANYKSFTLQDLSRKTD